MIRQVLQALFARNQVPAPAQDDIRKQGLFSIPEVRARSEEYALMNDLRNGQNFIDVAAIVQPDAAKRFKPGFMKSVHDNAVQLAQLGLEPYDETPTGIYVRYLRTHGMYDRLLVHSPS